MSTSMTGVYPWVGYQVNDRVSVWGTTGYGTGALSLTPDAASALETGVSMMMSAVGTRGELFGLTGHGRFRAGVQGRRAVGGRGERSARRPGRPAERLRGGGDAGAHGAGGFAGLHAGRRPAVADPERRGGLRRDGGDAETGAGMDVGGGLAFTDVVTGLSLDLRVRTLVVHQADGFRSAGYRCRSGGTRRRRARWL